MGLVVKNLRDLDNGIYLVRKMVIFGIFEGVEFDVKIFFLNEGFSENFEGLFEVNFKIIWIYMFVCLE